MTQIYENLSTQDADIELTDYSPTDKLLLTIDTLNTTIELVMTKDQLQQLRDSIAHTTEEAKEEEAEFKK